MDAGRLAVTIVLTVAALIAGIAVALGREWANRRCSLIERGVAFAGSEVPDGPSLPALLRSAKAGEKVKVKVLRDGKELELEAAYPAAK